MSIHTYNYHMDRRVQAANRTRPAFDEKAMTLSVTMENEEGEESVFAFPAKYEVCDLCDGKGLHVDPSVDASGISPHDDFYDMDFEEAYFGGCYDVECYECHGKRVIPVINTDRLTPKQEANLETWYEELREQAEYDRMCAQERAMGA